MSCINNQHVIIVGAGFAGMALAIKLKQAGNDDFTILEKAGDVGGTWRDNHYPGAVCDVPSHVYSYSFEPNPEWSQIFAGQAEIYAYMRKCADKHDLRRHTRFNTEVASASYDDTTGLWTTAIKGQEPLVGRYYVPCTGGLSRPAMPNIPGLKNFKGTLFHSARWNHTFLATGRAGIVGTGASSIQIIPAIAAKTKALKIFQRTPAWVIPKKQRAISSIMQRAFKKVPALQWVARQLLYWLAEMRALALIKPRFMKYGQHLALKHLESKVKDKALRDKLTPNYTMGCKRILLSDDFYDAFAHEHVNLVTDGIECVTETGIRTIDGVNHDLDAIICATGFQIGTAPYPVTGLNGLDLNTVWAPGAEAYLGVTVSGFPNMFMLVGPNSGLGHNSIIYIIEAQATYAFDAISKMKKHGLKSVAVKTNIQSNYQIELQRRFKGTVWMTGGCNSWYQTDQDKNIALWPGFSFQLRAKLSNFRLSEYELQHLDHSSDLWSNSKGRLKGLAKFY